ncbi:LysR substrate-binding domain-containing protein [Streptomyces sp. AD681]|uniref:LysR substrate-binding domain-containing protein n=1 Tax=Streptomyces sp. AD681 TaxID=3019069 RepID=UPI003FA7103A
MTVGTLVADDDLCAAPREVPLVTYAEDLPILRRYWRTVFGKQLTTRAAVTVPNLYAVLSAVNAGAGVSVLPRSLCQEYLDSGRLSLRPRAPQSGPPRTSSGEMNRCTPAAGYADARPARRHSAR